MTPHDALVATMIATSAADGTLSDEELDSIRSIISVLPVFAGFDASQVPQIADRTFSFLDADDGLDRLVATIGQALPGRLNETAYALACDVAAADGSVNIEELRLLEILRHDLDVDRLTAAAIERGARARHARLPN
ncbi:tellurite resistance TerB family protein [Roseobacter sp. HKCCA0434]|uniref:tellurite resistance TerB family protein n=1 Tax=Roseobacter sp. HKCCA0434 TaxID=3079297 RepID=UPI002905E337|nr:tellurite resistance TerB family protein [Roseobacter sp. HKCCA0434]